jgi:hypothetical protein
MMIMTIDIGNVLFAKYIVHSTVNEQKKIAESVFSIKRDFTKTRGSTDEF